MYINPFSAAEEVCQSDECLKDQKEYDGRFFRRDRSLGFEAPGGIWASDDPFF
jgi:hypothetical protein